jgi:phosphomannomutase / phosphoglucomutase
MTAQSIDHPTIEKWLSGFGAYDVRALAGQTITEETYYAFGQSFSLWLQEVEKNNSKSNARINKPLSVAVGFDARVHSPNFSKALIQGLLDAGIAVLDLGIAPTPLVYFAEYLQEDSTAELPLDVQGLLPLVATLTVTASHNPAPYNGLKLTYQGVSFEKDQMLAFKNVFSEYCYSGKKLLPAAESLPPTCVSFDIIQAYLNYIKRFALPDNASIKVAVDCGNGTAGVVARQVYQTVGATPQMLFEEPDGTFPNHHPDPCVHQNLVDLIHEVKATQADLGLAFDGDSDRLGVVDENGEIIPGDMLLLIYAEDVLNELRYTGKAETHPLAVVSEVKCSQVLFDQIQALQGKAIMSPTGHAFIKQRMVVEHSEVGGELSGHFFFRDVHYGFDDAFYSGVRLLQILAKHKQKNPQFKFSQLLAHLPKTILSEEKRVHCPKNRAQEVIGALYQHCLQQVDIFGTPWTDIVDIDGIRVNIPNGFILIRPSNTEPCLTIRYEAPEKGQFLEIEKKLFGLLDQVLSEKGLSLTAAIH